MLINLRKKKLTPTFIPNPEGQLSTTKSSESLRNAHLSWRKAQKSKKNLKPDEKQLAYWSKMCAARSF